MFAEPPRLEVPEPRIVEARPLRGSLGTKIVYDDGTILILMGGPSTGELAAQGAALLGLYTAALGQATLRGAAGAMLKEAARDQAENLTLAALEEALGVPVPILPRRRRHPKLDKSLFVGQAQRTGTQGHVFRTWRKAVSMGRSGRYSRIWFNRAYVTATGTKTVPRRVPDVIGRRKSGQYDAVEVPSKTDNVAELIRRNRRAMSQLPLPQQGNVQIEYIR
jgi:hypothetical protein